jgi:hypothetical protein
MSHYLNYNQYLGSQRCCNLKTQGPQGTQGPTGPAAVGPIGYTGPTGSKTFVIDHPLDEKKYLVHACLEGPESGVYYRGKGEITNHLNTIIELPDYVEKLAYDFTIQVTPIYSGKIINQIHVTEINNNSFQVYGDNCKFFWLVLGKRINIEIEPLKSETDVKGDGPYTWI